MAGEQWLQLEQACSESIKVSPEHCFNGSLPPFIDFTHRNILFLNVNFGSFTLYHESNFQGFFK